MSRTHHQDIRIGTLAKWDSELDTFRKLRDLGFESLQLTAWEKLPDLDFAEHAALVREILGDRVTISSVGVYGNPLTNEVTRTDFERALSIAHHYGAGCVCGFAGAQEDRSVDQNMPRFKEVWAPLVKIAEDRGLKIAFENCDMGGVWNMPRWNIAHSPRAWEMMFNEVPNPALGLEWEPCHQMVSFVDPIAQLRDWTDRIHHIHGKDATVHHDLVRKYGTRSGLYVVQHRTPGFGDTNWKDVISALRDKRWRGSIDIEGWHDHVYRDDLEMTGQVAGLRYLQECRGGEYIDFASI